MKFTSLTFPAIKALPVCLLCALSSSIFAGDIPFAIENLNKQRDTTIQAINLTYTKELEKLKQRYLQEGNLDAANQAVKEIKDIAISSFSLDGVWVVRCPEHPEATESREFKAGQLICPSRKRTFPTTTAGTLVTVHWDDNGWEKLTINPEQPDTLKGTNHMGWSLIYTRKISVKKSTTMEGSRFNDAKIVRTFLEGAWLWNGNEKREFRGNKFYAPNGKTALWSRKGNIITLNWGKGNIQDYLTVDPARPDVMTGTNSNGEKLILSRIKL